MIQYLLRLRFINLKARTKKTNRFIKMNRKHKIIVLLSITVLSWVFGFFYFMYGKVHVLKEYDD
jgi:ABC-type polysaccharide transport system permease subunit